MKYSPYLWDANNRKERAEKIDAHTTTRFMWFPKTRAMYMGSLQFYYDGYMEEIPIKRIGHLKSTQILEIPSKLLGRDFSWKSFSQYNLTIF